MSTQRLRAQEWKAALDADDFAAAEALIAPDAVYSVAGDTLVGPSAILDSYRQASCAAHAAFDAVGYRSTIVAETDRDIAIRFFDDLRFGDRTHVHQCEQDVELSNEGLITRIRHRDIPGQRELVRQFMSEVGTRLRSPAHGKDFDREAIIGEVRRKGVVIPEHVTIDCFGNTAEMAAELGALVRAGTKRATASLLWAWQSEGCQPPTAGDLEIVVDWWGWLVAVIETTEVRHVPFSQVDAAFARDEGEGDGSLRHWRLVHSDYFKGECESFGKQPDADMPVVCQRFRLLWPRGPGAAIDPHGRQAKRPT